MRLGVLGGTFNPPHLAHLLCASEAADQLDLDRVLLVPANEPPHKEVPGDPGPEVRAGLCDVAVAGDPRLAVSRIELERGGRSFTVDTLRALRGAHPGADLWFIVGGDMAMSLPTWREPVEILRLARLAVAERSGAVRQDITDRLRAELPGAETRIDFFAMPRLDVSSSEIRRRAGEGRSVRYLVPDAVAERVRELGLYRGGGT